ncbi:MAG TPA: histidine phosphatase family protein [Marmoricola sp.]|nr:histidine phosphatase family protein [Marmoricola sp.]
MRDEARRRRRRLLVLRHAKAEAVAASDHARRLTARGRHDAAEAGHWARSVDVVPDHALVSDAARAQETWEAFREAADVAVEAELVAALYPAGTDAALEILRTAPDSATTVLVVGHNPTMEQLVHLLDDGDADPESFAAVSAGFPTSALAVLEVDGPWSGLDLGGARIAAFHVGRG